MSRSALLSAGSGGVRRGRAFTLIELLVVVAIIALLVSILVPSLGKAKELARKAVCKANLHAQGRGWAAYWAANNYMQPAMILGTRWSAADTISQYNDRLNGNWGNWTGQGFLHRGGFTAGERVFACPTVEMTVGGRWFGTQWVNGGLWPPHAPGVHVGESISTYGIRRMANYDDMSLADADVSWDQPSPRTNDIMLMKCGVESIPQGSSFSLVADCFHFPEIALQSHVPGINVLHLDGHVGWFQDNTTGGDILYYGNGISGWGFNWIHDNIWMVIDGYHAPPP